MLNDRHSRGFSLIELIIGMAILALLLALGMPMLSTYLQNAKIRSAAENFLTGAQKARTEAVSRNAAVEFLLISSPPDVYNVNSPSLSATGPNWMIRTFNATINAYDFIQGKTMFEGAGQTQGATPAVQISSEVSTITFNGFGTTNLTESRTFGFSNPTGGACAPGGPMRCLNVIVSVGGQVRMCDPAVTAAGDTRSC